MAITTCLQLGIQAFDACPDAKRKCIVDQSFGLQIISNLRGGFARLDLDGNDFTGAAINRLKNLRGGIPEIKDATKNQYAQQEYRYNGAACGALLHRFVSSILGPCASRYSWRITAAARASIS